MSVSFKDGKWSPGWIPSLPSPSRHPGNKSATNAQAKILSINHFTTAWTS
jgi:hypothetical protein